MALIHIDWGEVTQRSVAIERSGGDGPDLVRAGLEEYHRQLEKKIIRLYGEACRVEICKCCGQPKHGENT